MNPLVLLLLPHFLPGSRYGGPVRTIANLLTQLDGRYRFHLLTSDREFHDQRPYDLPANRWLPWQGQTRVRYADPRHLGPRDLRELGRELRPDVVYLNSFFHPRFSLLPYALWRRGAFGAAGLVLAPRGEFAPGALAQKALKKRLLLGAARLAGRYREPLWQASSPFEAQDIQRVWPGARLQIARNLGTTPADLPARERGKRAGELRLLFVGRVSRMKNLDFLLERLTDLPGRVELQVAGPAEDAGYLELCRAVAARLPASVQVRFLGAVEPAAVPGLLRNADLLFQPSLGENFGHAILEALAHGLPALISDRTPWRGLSAAQAGWDLPLEDPAAFRTALLEALALDEPAWQSWSHGARELGLRSLGDPEPVLQHEELFRRAMADHRWRGRA
ncbi:MAG: glycosyltransferase family 4 protein [Candidatus Delongbacteria bacterium]